MENLKELYGKALAKKWINQISRGAYCISLLETYLKDGFKIENLEIKWSIKNNILFVWINPENIAMEIFLLKKEILKHLNLKLKEMKYNKITDIRKKQFDF